MTRIWLASTNGKLKRLSIRWAKRSMPISIVSESTSSSNSWMTQSARVSRWTIFACLRASHASPSQINLQPSRQTSSRRLLRRSCDNTGITLRRTMLPQDSIGRRETSLPSTKDYMEESLAWVCERVRLGNQWKWSKARSTSPSTAQASHATTLLTLGPRVALRMPPLSADTRLQRPSDRQAPPECTRTVSISQCTAAARLQRTSCVARFKRAFRADSREIALSNHPRGRVSWWALAEI